GIGSKLLKRIGYEGKGLGVNGQGIVNPIKVGELTRQEGLGYSRKEVGECDPPTTNDGQPPSSVLSKSKEKVKHVDFHLISSTDGMISVGDLEIPITGTNMRLLTKTSTRRKSLVLITKA